MSVNSSLATRWADCLRGSARPGPDDLREHLLEVHRRRTGFTEACAWRSRDSEGRNSYEWLAQSVDTRRHRTVLDLACGSGPLSALCRERLGPEARLIGVDMSADELSLARERLAGADVALHQAMAQDLAWLADGSIDAVLCHWALTLMDPVEPVLAEIRRVLRSGGVFAAIVDGDMTNTPCYEAQHHIIYDHVRREFPRYGSVDMGDPRVRTPDALAELVNEFFRGHTVRIEPSVVELEDEPRVLAEQAAGFFYSSFVLSPAAHDAMLEELTADFSKRRRDGAAHGRFRMPINRLVVELT